MIVIRNWTRGHIKPSLLENEFTPSKKRVHSGTLSKQRHERAIKKDVISMRNRLGYYKNFETD